MNKDFAKALLSIQLQKNDADALNVQQYMRELLASLLDEEEGFSGKRPFGNSGWQYEYLDAIKEADLFTADATRSEIHSAIIDAIFGE
jgi:hypothetical protein